MGKKLIAGFTAGLLFFTQSFATFNIDGAILEMSAPSVVKGREMTTISGGGVRFRIQDETFRPFSIVPPSIRTGCGGIDATFGAFSYFNMEYLGQFLQNVLQGAPVIAFELALHTICPQCEQLLSKLTSLANQINQIGVNKCATIQAITTLGKQWIDSALGKQDSERKDPFKKLEDWVKNAQNEIEKISAKLNRYCPNGNCLVGIYLRVDGPPRSVVNLAVEGGDIPLSIARILGISQLDFEALIRYYYGDIILIPPKRGEDGGDGGTIRVEPARANPSDVLWELVYGFDASGVSGRTNVVGGLDFNDGTITQRSGGISVRPLKSAVAELTRGIKRKLLIRQPLNDEEKALLASIPAPVLTLINTASVDPGLLDAVFDGIDEYLANELAYAILQGIYKGLARWGGACISEIAKEEKKPCEEWMENLGSTSRLLVEKRREYQKSLAQKLQTAEVAYSVQARIMAQMAGSPIYGSYIYSQMLGVAR